MATTLKVFGFSNKKYSNFISKDRQRDMIFAKNITNKLIYFFITQTTMFLRTCFIKLC